MKWKYFGKIILIIFFFYSFTCHPIFLTAADAAKEPAKNPYETKNIYAERKKLLDDVSSATGIPWYYLAAIDQYERSLSIANRKKRPLREGLIAIYITELKWGGMLNPDPEDTNTTSISFFDGLGKDGSGDGLANRQNDLDVLSAITSYLLQHGAAGDDLRIALWDYYQNARSVERIEQFSRIYATFNSLDLDKHVFPVPTNSRYSYRGTWGAPRGWGGYRIHEGSDIFAGYGVPVRSTSYGVVEVMGWNAFGGWRVGIRDINNVYHYYAHLSGFDKTVKIGDIVKPGQVVGWVGSSGYGKPGTQGKFPPHLHYGVYRDNGFIDWAFDPYPMLRKWERDERSKRAKRK